MFPDQDLKYALIKSSDVLWPVKSPRRYAVMSQIFT